MVTASKRVLWKGAISFGLVYIPVALHSATQDQGLHFDWLDKRTMDPVGYKRINKKTGKEVAKEDIVKGIEYEKGNYVILSSEEIAAAYPKTTQTIEIEQFVSSNAIPFLYLERPYYISPAGKGEKVYALLREILIKTGKVGLAKVVIQSKQHLAILAPLGPALVLNLLRWGDEIRTWEELELPKEGSKAVGLTEKEIKLGEQLVEDMSGEWDPQQFTDSFKEQILQLIEEKVQAGETQTVMHVEPVELRESARIYDLTEMLERSLKHGETTFSGEEQKSPAKSRTRAKADKSMTARTTAKSAVKKSSLKNKQKRHSA